MSLEMECTRRELPTRLLQVSEIANGDVPCRLPILSSNHRRDSASIALNKSSPFSLYLKLSPSALSSVSVIECHLNLCLDRTRMQAVDSAPDIRLGRWLAERWCSHLWRFWESRFAYLRRTHNFERRGCLGNRSVRTRVAASSSAEAMCLDDSLKQLRRFRFQSDCCITSEALCRVSRLWMFDPKITKVLLKNFSFKASLLLCSMCRFLDLLLADYRACYGKQTLGWRQCDQQIDKLELIDFGFSSCSTATMNFRSRLNFRGEEQWLWRVHLWSMEAYSGHARQETAELCR